MIIILILVISLELFALTKYMDDVRKYPKRKTILYSPSYTVTVVSTTKQSSLYKSMYLLTCENITFPTISRLSYKAGEVVKLYKDNGQFKAGYDRFYTDDPNNPNILSDEEMDKYNDGCLHRTKSGAILTLMSVAAVILIPMLIVLEG